MFCSNVAVEWKDTKEKGDKKLLEHRGRCFLGLQQGVKKDGKVAKKKENSK